MPVSPDLTSALKKVVLTLEDDLRARVSSQSEVDTAWRGLHAQAVDRERTAMSWQAWRDDRVTQAAVAWVLTTVFVRFCEDNRLLRPVWIAGPGERRQESLDAELQYFRENPEHTDREWLLQSVEHLAALRATRDLVGSHSPLWTVSPSGQAVKSLLSFWRQTRDDGSLVWDFTDRDLSTRFLGDLYQDLSDYAKKTFALLQTPEFVEEFILDQTMEPALAERPLEGFRMIDPTCGSGHFLLGAFARLNDRWATHAPGLEPRARVQKALDAVHGVDLNPFAVAIARFRLMVAALKACGEHSLEDAPGFTFHLAAGDSLLHGGHQFEMHFEGFDASSQLTGFAYDTEDLEQLREILRPGHYDTVVGNPPYITVRDRKLKATYKSLYPSCVGLWVLSVPFMERFFELAVAGSNLRPAGWIGKITANSFMRSEFGERLIEDYLIRKDLKLLIDSSGAYIPGHGTPTLILIGTNQRPISGSVRTVQGIHGEPSAPAVASQGVVWRSIKEHYLETGFQNQYVAVSMFDRERLRTHPWNLAGGGVAELLTELEQFDKLGPRIARLGLYGDSHADEAFFLPIGVMTRNGVPSRLSRPAAKGEDVRDWAISRESSALLPARAVGVDSLQDALGAGIRLYWPLRTELWSRSMFGGGSYRSEGRDWLDWHQLPLDQGTHKFTITFAFVATHNHFALDQSGMAFNRAAPVIKLDQTASDDAHFELLGTLNTSVTAFVLRQLSNPKGGSGIGRGIQPEAWMERYGFNAASVAEVPLPSQPLGERTKQMYALAERRAGVLIDLANALANSPSGATVDSAGQEHEGLLGAMIGAQEELDWEAYRSYRLIDHDLTFPSEPPAVRLGERAFEIALARRVAAGAEKTAWFSRHGSQPVTEIPERWPPEYRELVQRRLDAIESSPFVALLERPEYKRRWTSLPWDKQVEQTLVGWLLDRLEDRRFWFDASGRPAVRSVGQLADEVSRDPDLVSVLELWSGRKDQSVTAALTALLDTESVPFLAAYRLKDSGLRKREAWEHTWDLQRREDAGEAVGDIPVPPKYTSADFRKTSWWQHRGKLDVPKERFILYPDAGRETDPTPVLGWAGWDHAQQALALAALIQDRETEGWDDERLIPLIAGLAELQPWVRQWHDETDATFGVNLADYLEEQLRSRASQVARTLDELHAWRPAPPARGRRPRA